MFCPGCGKEVTNETGKFCSECGFDISLLKIFMENPSIVSGKAPVQSAFPAAHVEQNRPVAGRIMATEIPSEEPTIQMQARPDLLIRNTRAMYQRIGQPMPLVLKDALYKVKCAYCSAVFTYYQSNTIVHRNFPGGYVDCPLCRNHLAHNKSLFLAEYDFNVRDYS